jgi:DNA-binding SARP family transcriptional activator
VKTEGALVLRLFGGLRLERSGVPLTGPATRRKPLALLAVLAAHPSGISRDKLEALLWSEADSGSARTVLRQTLYSLRRALGEPDLFIGTTEVRLNPDVILSDVAQFDAALRRGDREAAIERYSGPFSTAST